MQNNLKQFDVLKEENTLLSTPATGGDVDTNKYQADVVGEEAVGGTTPTPGQNDVDKLANSLGVELNDAEELGIKDKLEKRDNQRPELDLDERR